MTALRPPPRLLALVLAAATAGAPAAATAGAPEPAPMDPRAKAHLDRALDLYQKGEHAAAIEEFKAGYAIDPRRDFLFAWAQSERQNGDCVTANELYKRFIAERPPDVQVAAAEKGIEICDKELADKRNAPEGPTPEELAAAEEQQRREAEEQQRREAEEQQRREADEAAARERSRRFYLDPLGDGLVAGGLAAAITGGALLTVAQVKVARHADAPTYGDFAADHDAIAAESRTFRIAGGALIGVGAALIAGGVARWMIVRAGGNKSRASAWLVPQRAGLAIQGRF